MEIREVNTIEEARECDKLLTELIRDEATYNEGINSEFIVNNYFENIYFNKNNILLIAVEENKIIGYAFAKKIATDEIVKSALIDGVFVVKNSRNKGIATKLIEKIQKWAIDYGIDDLKIRVVIENKKAYNLYKKLGFKEYSIELTKKI